MQQDVAINYSTLSKSTVIYCICDLVPRNPSISSCNFMLRATHLFIAHNWYKSDSTISYIANWYLWCRILWTLVFRITVHLMKWRHCRLNFEMNIFLIWKKAFSDIHDVQYVQFIWYLWIVGSKEYADACMQKSV